MADVPPTKIAVDFSWSTNKNNQVESVSCRFGANINHCMTMAKPISHTTIWYRYHIPNCWYSPATKSSTHICLYQGWWWPSSTICPIKVMVDGQVIVMVNDGPSWPIMVAMVTPTKDRLNLLSLALSTWLMPTARAAKPQGFERLNCC